MAKRFIDTTIWTQNQWFRELKTKTKLFWFYLITNCDNVGVWEADFDVVCFVLNENIVKGEVYADLNGKIFIMSEKKILIKDFCNFQYGELIEANTTNKPHQSYIKLLKQHGLWQIYQLPMDELDKEMLNKC
jgi:hypothetical protein